MPEGRNAGKINLAQSLLQDHCTSIRYNGTTRDTIEEILNIQGILFSLNRYSGTSREAQDQIEKDGRGNGAWKN